MSSKTIAIVQSNYVPWKGYFDLINTVDEFVILDDVQFTRRDWRNRNRIKTKDGLKWLTIPVESKGKYTQRIRDTRVADSSWQQQHLATLVKSYSRAAHFGEYRDFLTDLYASCRSEFLSEINHHFLTAICRSLAITTPLKQSDELEILPGKSERLLHICRQLDADCYLSGPSAKEYLDEHAFQQEGIEVQYFDYSGYAEYQQLFPPFEHAVSIIDLIFNTGTNASRYLKSFNGSEGQV